MGGICTCKIMCIWKKSIFIKIFASISLFCCSCYGVVWTSLLFWILNYPYMHRYTIQPSKGVKEKQKIEFQNRFSLTVTSSQFLTSWWVTSRSFWPLLCSSIFSNFTFTLLFYFHLGNIEPPIFFPNLKLRYPFAGYYIC